MQADASDIVGTSGADLWTTSDVVMVGLIHRSKRNFKIREMVAA
jgi:hypothetical protein